MPDLIAAVETPETTLDSSGIHRVSDDLLPGDGGSDDFGSWLRDCGRGTQFNIR